MEQPQPQIKLDYLADHLDLIPTITRWVYDEWGSAGETYESWLEGMRRRANREMIPVTIIAFAGDEPVGTATVALHDMKSRMDLTPWGAGVFVQPEYRGRGIATALMRKIEGIARDMGYQTLYLYTRSAEGLYERLGWVVISREDYQGREVALMAKELD